MGILLRCWRSVSGEAGEDGMMGSDAAVVAMVSEHGLIRQYLPKGQSMARLTQHDRNRIATQLNTRPRKRLGYRTPEGCYAR